MESRGIDRGALQCTICQQILAGKKYLKHDNKPVCLSCFEDHCAHRCNGCHNVIGPDQREAHFKEKHWHVSCFACWSCNIPLVEKQFACSLDHIFCLKCYQKIPASKCRKCDSYFRDGQVKYEFDGGYWHEDCFRCQHCRDPIKANLFVLHNDDPLCVTCYEVNYAPKCAQCHKIISNGGLRSGNQSWHGSCFNCQLCNKNLSESDFMIVDAQIFCYPCFKQQNDKKCFRCSDHIKGEGNTRSVSFEGKHWHNGCFNCKTCGSNLVDKSFLVAENEVKCPFCVSECHKFTDESTDPL